MLARIQQFTTLVLILSAAIWALLFVRAGHWEAAVAGALAIVLGYAAFLAAEFAMLALTYNDSEERRPTTTQLLSAWWGEALTAPQVFCWRQPFKSESIQDCSQPGAGVARGVVLVHGFVCNRGLWNPWMTKLRDAEVAFTAVNLEPVFGSIDAYVAIIEKAVQRIEAATSQAPVIVAHSMGGLAVRAWLASGNHDDRVHRVITIGTPHRGTWLAQFGHTTNGKQMRMGGEWLQDLAATETPARLANFTCIYSHCDNIVFPHSTATLPHADNQHVPATAHVRLAFEGTAYKELTRWISLDPAADNSPPRPVHAAAARRST
jgi:triacylglycerol lipase